MDVFFRISDLQFTWDEDKANWNRAKHGLSFETAAEVFLDPLTRYEDASAEDELRLAAVGMSRERRLLFVVHVEREDNLIRIISARHGDAVERRNYEEHA